MTLKPINKTTLAFLERVYPQWSERKTNWVAGFLSNLPEKTMRGFKSCEECAKTGSEAFDEWDTDSGYGLAGALSALGYNP